MMLHDLYLCDVLWALPYKLLQEREPHENISHKRMPEWDEHVSFILSKPYTAWYWFAGCLGQPAGCIYLTKQDEIGVGVLKDFRGQGLAKEAVQELMKKYPGPKLANINPANEASAKLFKSLGFGLIQHTYSSRP